MKTTVAGLLVVPLLALDPSPAAAQANRPWCAQYYGSLGGGTNCGFTSYEQCMMTAGPGTGAWCVQNPAYQAYGSGTAAPSRRRGATR
jgi:hypothetical protein